MRPLVVVVTGPTASGKTGLAIDIAERLGTEIISADSRQIYRDIPIITAAPTPEEQARVRHHLVGTLGLDQYYSAALFEQDALQLLEPLLDSRGVAVVAGGSTMYVDALVNGIDEMPAVSADVRAGVYAMSAAERLEMLRQIDPDYAASADTANTKRVAHALEVSLQAGRPYSSFLTGQCKQRPFDVLKVAIDRSRDDLFDRINRRTQLMLGQGMEDEARRCYPLRHLNSLNTVGFKEWFTYFDKQAGLLPDTGLPAASDALTTPEAVAARIAKNTRVYAKKQLTRLRPDPTVHWLPSTAPLLAALTLIRR